ncbi:hypothetical protein ACJX0J_024790, partial [Zea mays]
LSLSVITLRAGFGMEIKPCQAIFGTWKEQKKDHKLFHACHWEMIITRTRSITSLSKITPEKEKVGNSVIFLPFLSPIGIFFLNKERITTHFSTIIKAWHFST